METADRFGASGDRTPALDRVFAELGDIANAARAHVTAQAIADEVAVDPVRAELARLWDGANLATFAFRLETEARYTAKQTRRAINRGDVDDEDRADVSTDQAVLVLRVGAFACRVLAARLSRPLAARDATSLADLGDADDETDGKFSTWDAYLAHLVGEMIHLRDLLGIGRAPEGAD